MKCPHCLVEFHENHSIIHIGEDADGEWGLRQCLCPKCNRIILHLFTGTWRDSGGNPSRRMLHQGVPITSILVRPKVMNRPPVPPDVPVDFSRDYTEACLVVADSPKASAAISRRCLQHILREKAEVKAGNLAQEIQEAISSGKLPPYLSESLDAIRIIGNFAAHPTKSISSGEIISVEPGEAEWNLDVIEALYDFYFVQPELIRKKRVKLDEKLKDAGKPPMKHD